MSAERAAYSDTRRKLLEKVRNDWEFPDTPDAHLNGEQGQSACVELAHPVESITEWRERTYASSDPSSEEDEPELEKTITASSSSPPTRTHRFNSLRDDISLSVNLSSSRHGRNSSKFGDINESDKHATAERLRKEARKRRRRERLEEEMSWNTGMKFFQDRRDAWCCAKRIRHNDSTTSVLTHVSTPADPQTGSIVPVFTFDPNRPFRRQSQQSQSSLSQTSASTGSLKLSSSASTSNSSNFPHAISENHQDEETVFLPLAPPLLPPSDPARQQPTQHASYATIYSKIVTQSLRPSAPVNLAHMVPILVDGWQREGEWPPKESAPPGAAPRKAGTAQQDHATPTPSNPGDPAKWRDIPASGKNGRSLGARSRRFMERQHARLMSVGGNASSSNSSAGTPIVGMLRSPRADEGDTGMANGGDADVAAGPPEMEIDEKENSASKSPFRKVAKVKRAFQMSMSMPGKHIDDEKG